MLGCLDGFWYPGLHPGLLTLRPFGLVYIMIEKNHLIVLIFKQQFYPKCLYPFAWRAMIWIAPGVTRGMEYVNTTRQGCIPRKVFYPKCLYPFAWRAMIWIAPGVTRGIEYVNTTRKGWIPRKVFYPKCLYSICLKGNDVNSPGCNPGYRIRKSNPAGLHTTKSFCCPKYIFTYQCR